MNKTKFEVTENHIKLLKSAYTSWESCEFGAPSIDYKRPYGNSDVYSDIAEILGIMRDDPEDGWTDEQINLMDKVHSETETALQIFLVTGFMKDGMYEAEKYHKNWQLCE
jgi:hypothetical protein